MGERMVGRPGAVGSGAERGMMGNGFEDGPEGLVGRPVGFGSEEFYPTRDTRDDPRKLETMQSPIARRSLEVAIRNEKNAVDAITPKQRPFRASVMPDDELFGPTAVPGSETRLKDARVEATMAFEDAQRIAEDLYDNGLSQAKLKVAKQVRAANEAVQQAVETSRENVRTAVETANAKIQKTMIKGKEEVEQAASQARSVINQGKEKAREIALRTTEEQAEAAKDLRKKISAARHDVELAMEKAATNTPAINSHKMEEPEDDNRMM